MDTRKVDYNVTLDEIYNRRGLCRVKLRDRADAECRYCRNRADAGSLFCQAHGGRLASERAVVEPDPTSG